MHEPTTIDTSSRPITQAVPAAQQDPTSSLLHKRSQHQQTPLLRTLETTAYNCSSQLQCQSMLVQWEKRVYTMQAVLPMRVLYRVTRYHHKGRCQMVAMLTLAFKIHPSSHHPCWTIIIFSRHLSSRCARFTRQVIRLTRFLTRPQDNQDHPLRQTVKATRHQGRQVRRHHRRRPQAVQTCSCPSTLKP